MENNRSAVGEKYFKPVALKSDEMGLRAMEKSLRQVFYDRLQTEPHESDSIRNDMNSSAYAGDETIIEMRYRAVGSRPFVRSWSKFDFILEAYGCSRRLPVKKEPLTVMSE